MAMFIITDNLFTGWLNKFWNSSFRCILLLFVHRKEDNKRLKRKLNCEKKQLKRRKHQHILMWMLHFQKPGGWQSIRETFVKRKMSRDTFWDNMYCTLNDQVLDFWVHANHHSQKCLFLILESGNYHSHVVLLVLKLMSNSCWENKGNYNRERGLDMWS